VGYGIAAPIDFQFKIYPDALFIDAAPAPEVNLYQVLSPGFVVLVTGGMADGEALEVMLTPEDGLYVKIELRDARSHRDVSANLVGDAAALITQNSAVFDNLAVHGALADFYFKFSFDYGASGRECNTSHAACPRYCCTRSSVFYIPYQLRARAPCFDLSTVFRVRARDSLPWPTAAALTAGQLSWGRVVLVASASSPEYSPAGGPRGNGHLRFTRNQSQVLDAGAWHFNPHASGGLTVVAVLKFTSVLPAGFIEAGAGGEPSMESPARGLCHAAAVCARVLSHLTDLNHSDFRKILRSRQPGARRTGARRTFPSARDDISPRSSGRIGTNARAALRRAAN